VIRSLLLQMISGVYRNDANYFRQKLSGNDQKTITYGLKSGEVVFDQFHGHNDVGGKAVLDFGCGNGFKSIYYASMGANRTVGVDVSLDVSLAKKVAEEKGLMVEYLPMEGALVPLADDSIDLVISSNVLEHVEQPEITLKEISRVLKPGGLFLCRWHPFRTRYGGHLNDILSLPFVHLFFPEKVVVNLYITRLLKIFNVHQADALLGKRKVSWNKISSYGELFNFPLNYQTVAMMRPMILDRFKLIKESYYKGVKVKSLIKSIPVKWREWFFDYEVLVLKNIK
jgi:SAM-dependent methyltransferase